MADANEFITDLAQKLIDQNVVDMPREGMAERTQAADSLANSDHHPQLVTFAGYLGGLVSDTRGTEWRMLYLDTRLERWLLVKDEDILYTTKVDDDTSPSKSRDVIWLSADARVGQGSGSQSVEARFLTGDFTRAGDYESTPTGGTLTAATGVFCEAKTPTCCYRRSRG
jgi:hypothetical protein